MQTVNKNPGPVKKPIQIIYIEHIHKDIPMQNQKKEKNSPETAKNFKLGNDREYNNGSAVNQSSSVNNFLDRGIMVVSS